VLREILLIKAKDLKVSAAEVKEFFDANKERLGSPESVRLRHSLVATEKDAYYVAGSAHRCFPRHIVKKIL